MNRGFARWDWAYEGPRAARDKLLLFVAVPPGEESSAEQLAVGFVAEGVRVLLVGPGVKPVAGCETRKDSGTKFALAVKHLAREEFDWVFVWDADIDALGFSPRICVEWMRRWCLDAACPSLAPGSALYWNETRVCNITLGTGHLGRLMMAVPGYAPVYSRWAWDITAAKLEGMPLDPGWCVSYTPVGSRAVIDAMPVKKTKGVPPWNRAALAAEVAECLRRGLPDPSHMPFAPWTFKPVIGQFGFELGVPGPLPRGDMSGGSVLFVPFQAKDAELGTVPKLCRRFLDHGARVILVQLDDLVPGIPAGCEIVVRSGWKFPLAFELLRDVSFDLAYIWDSDLDPLDFDPAEFKRVMLEAHLDRAVPTLSDDSVMDWGEGQVQHDVVAAGFKGRYTSAMSIQCPVFTRRAFEIARRRMEGVPLLDAWQAGHVVTGNSGFVDCQQIKHCRPMSGQGNRLNTLYIEFARGVARGIDHPCNTPLCVIGGKF